jgi:hypothetical protein
VAQQAGSAMTEGKPASGQAPGSGGGGMGGAGIGNIADGIGGLVSGLGGMIPGVGGLASGLGSAIGGLGHMFGSTDAARFAARYFEADGSFLGEGGIDQADFPFAGSGPARQDWATTSEDYVDEHEKTNRHETWHTDSDGDIIKHTTPRQRPKQAAIDEDALSASAREFWADIADPNTSGYFNPRNRPYQEDDSDQYKPGPEGEQGQHEKKDGQGGGMPDAFGGALEGGEGAGELGELAMLAARSDDDGSDIVREFQASAGAQSLMRGKSSGGSGRFDDFAGAADRFLKTAGRNYSAAEQAELEDESHPQGARNLGGLDLRNTHYE